jgi:hypothetical protein
VNKKSVFTLVAFLFLLGSNGYAGILHSPCDSKTQDELGHILLRCNEDTFHIWKIRNSNKDEMICNALKGYQKRRKEMNICLIGTISISAPCLVTLLAFSMSSDAGNGLSNQLNTASYWLAGIGALNAAIWMGTFTAVYFNKTEQEKDLIREYKSTRTAEQSYYYKSMRSVTLLSMQF